MTRFAQLLVTRADKGPMHAALTLMPASAPLLCSGKLLSPAQSLKALSVELDFRVPDPAGNTKQFFGQMGQVVAPRSDASKALINATLLRAQGFRAGLLDQPSPEPTPLDPLDFDQVNLMQVSAQTFLGWLYQGELVARRLPSVVTPVIDAFLIGARKAFAQPNLKLPDFLRKPGKSWGKLVHHATEDPTRHALIEYSHKMGQAVATELLAMHVLGRTAGISNYLLKGVNHRRYWPDFIYAAGYLLGQTERLHQAGADHAETLAGNHRSILVNMNRSGRLEYVGEVLKEVPHMRAKIEKGLVRFRQTGQWLAADALHRNAGTIINHSLNSGKLDYCDAAIKALPAMLQTVTIAIKKLRKRDTAAAHSLTANRDTIIGRFLADSDLKFSDPKNLNLIAFLEAAHAIALHRTNLNLTQTLSACLKRLKAG